MKELVLAAACVVTPQNFGEVMQALPTPNRGIVLCAAGKCLERQEDYFYTLSLLEQAGKLLGAQTTEIERLKGGCKVDPLVRSTWKPT